MVMVRRGKNDSDERLIKRFLKKVKKLGIIQAVLDKRYYVKPSVKKRLEKKRQIAQHKKQMEKENR